jgi:hypothetical protein
MFEMFKGLNILDPKFFIPIIIGLIVIILIAKLAKKLIKFALLIALIGLALLVYFNLPSVKVDGSVATLKVNGQEYRINAKDTKIEKKSVDGRERVYLVSDDGKTRIELPFSADYAKRFVLSKINEVIEKQTADQNK